MAAIWTGFEQPEIILCYWHMLRAIRIQAFSKVQLSRVDEKKANLAWREKK